MSMDHASWWYGGDTYDRRTNERLDDLAAAQARSRSQLADQMRRETGSLQKQLDRLTEAFVAFVEYEDIRGELNQHVDAAAVRRYAREVVATTVMTGGSQLAALATPGDVPGYWLAPASRGLARAVTGSPDEAEDAFAEALRRDPGRAATFLVLLDAVRRDPRWGTSKVGAALPQDAAVTRSQRAVWVAAAEGRLGEEARRTLVTALTRLVGTPDPDVLLDALGTPTGAPHEKAVRRLARLRDLVDGTDTMPALSREDTDDQGAAEDPLADCLRSLVDEGAPTEADVLERMAAARERMGFVSARPAGERWDDPAGEVLDLVLADLAEPGGAGPRAALHAVAREVLAPALRSTADALEQDAIAAPPPHRTVSVLRQDITVTEKGATDSGWSARVAEAARARYPQPAWRRPTAYGAAALAVVMVVLALVAEPGLWLLAIGFGVAAGVLLWQDVTGAGTVRESVEHTLRVAHRDIESAARAIASERQSAADAHVQAAEHRQAVHAALATPAPATT